MKKWLKRIGIVFLIVIMLFGASFIPTLWLKSSKMHLLEGAWVDVYYETEKNAALDVFELAEVNAELLTNKLGLSGKQPVVIYIYDNQYVMQTKKYGWIIPLLGLDWYIGDNIGTNVILTSPAHSGKAHNYQSIKQASLHELVHAYVSIINPKIQLWLTEGCALYLSNGEEFKKGMLEYMKIPTYDDIHTSNPIYFANMGGYTFAHTYIEYLDVTYGWDKVRMLLETEEYEKTFGKNEKQLYDEWVDYITHYPR